MGYKVGPDRYGLDATNYVSISTAAAVTTQQISKSSNAVANGDYIDTILVSLNSSSTALGGLTLFDGTTAVFATVKQAAGNISFANSFYLGISAQSTQGFNITTNSSGQWVLVTGRF